MKDVSSQLVLGAGSAHGLQTKINVMSNEIKRIMRNCSVKVECSETACHLSYYMRRTQFSGYSEDIRYQVLKRGLAGWEKQQKGMRDGASQRVQNMSPTQIHRKKREGDWYMSGGDCRTVLFVEATPKFVVKIE